MEWPEITKDTPISEIQRIHKMIWDYVIEHGEKPDTPYFQDCSCCEYVSINDYSATRYKTCDDCPARWPSGSCLDEFKGLFTRWLKFCRTGNNAQAKKVAIQIRDIPFKEEVK